MNKDNLEYLQKGLLYTGFGDKLNKELETNISKQVPDFKLNYHEKFGNDTMDYELSFRKSDKSDMYFFNRYQATLNKDTLMEDKTQTFYINKNNGISAKESYNLLSGRSVNKDLYTKEGKPYNAWLKLDFDVTDKNNNYKIQPYTKNYGYNLEAVLASYPIKELTDAQHKDRLIKSLEKGNLVAVTFVKDGKEDKRFIEANPEYKTLNLYDASMKPIYQDNTKKETQSPREPEKKQEKSEKKDNDESDRKQNTSRKRGVKM